MTPTTERPPDPDEVLYTLRDMQKAWDDGAAAERERWLRHLRAAHDAVLALLADPAEPEPSE